MSSTTPTQAPASPPVPTSAEAAVSAHLSCSRCAPISPPRAGRRAAACSHVQTTASEIVEALTAAGFLVAPPQETPAGDRIRDSGGPQRL